MGVVRFWGRMFRGRGYLKAGGVAFGSKALLRKPLLVADVDPFVSRLSSFWKTRTYVCRIRPGDGGEMRQAALAHGIDELR